ncbi:DUF6869 domain-containing protein [Dyella sp.]|uniref:DUF6869 domain-containing protein n=1 Tax=Dyella sp. TaxID=1869338 RepID=UPI002D79C30F|nr:hypothetical protein [Dyella sp.]HET6430956.1 hypothetical protein [Dyella sp.]
MDSQAIEDWANAYIALQQDGSRPLDGHHLFWAAERFMFPVHTADAEDCWATILAILARAPPKDVLGLLAAGPLEDLIHHAGPGFIDRIELQARKDPAFRHLLGGVWASSTPDIWARIEAARGATW